MNRGALRGVHPVQHPGVGSFQVITAPARFIASPSGDTASTTMASGTVAAHPLFLPEDMAIDMISLSVTAAFTAGTLLTAIYEHDPQTGRPGWLRQMGHVLTNPGNNVWDRPLPAQLFRAGIIWVASCAIGATLGQVMRISAAATALAYGSSNERLNGSGNFVAYIKTGWADTTTLPNHLFDATFSTGGSAPHVIVRRSA